MTTITTAGNLAADPELRHTKNGRPVARFTILENRRTRTPEGEWTDAEPNAFRVQAWGQLAENIAASCHKGDRLHVSGQVVTDRWNDKETGDARTAQRIDADEVSVSLRWSTVTATKNERTANAADEAGTASWDVAEIPGDFN